MGWTAGKSWGAASYLKNITLASRKYLNYYVSTVNIR